MRLPNLDLTLLAAQYLLAAGGAGGVGGTTRAAPARPCLEGMRDATPLANATRAGLIDLPGIASIRLADVPPARRRAAHPRRRARSPADARPAPVSTTPPPARAPARRAAPPEWSRAWPTLSAGQRADLAQAIARARRTGVDLDACLAARAETHHTTMRHWLTQPLPAPDTGQAANGTDIAPLYRQLAGNATLTLDDAVALATALADARAAAVGAPPAMDRLYPVDRLADLFVLPALCQPSRDDLALLRHVHAGLATLFPAYRGTLLDAHAIAVATRLQERCAEPAPDALPGRSEASAHGEFHGRVSAALTAQARAALLLPRSDTPPANGQAWFDGIAVRDASGKTVRDLVEDLLPTALAHRLRLRADAGSHPARDADDRPLLDHWVRKRLVDLVESARFAFGTPPQSIDTVLLRLAGMQGVERGPGDDFAGVLRDFTRLCAAWQARPGYWMSPTLAAALHFAHASGTHDALRELDPREREHRLIDAFHERLRDYGSDGRDGRDGDHGHDARREGGAPARMSETPSARAAAAPLAAPSPDVRHAFLDSAESWLALPRWPMHVGRTLIGGDARNIAGLLPFVVPAYDIEEGVRLGNASRTLRGAFQFGADVVMSWIGGRIDASLAVQEALPALDREARAALSMLHRGTATLGEGHPRHLPLTERVATAPQPGIALVEAAAMPLRHRRLALRARAGETVPIRLPHAPHARLVHVPREHRVMPVAVTGSDIWQLDWQGHAVGTLARDRAGGVANRLLAETREPANTLAGRRAPPGSGSDGRTVDSIERWLAALPEAPARGAPDLAEAETALREVLAFDTRHADEHAMFREWRSAYRQSPTFRLIVHAAGEHAAGRRLGLSIEAGAMPHYAPGRHMITVPRASEIAGIDYIGWNGPQRFDARDVWIHEFIHAMTGMGDPERSLAALHRGPVVYLTDRILYEINRRSPERIAYAPPRGAPGVDAAGQSARVRERVVRENIVLDEQLALRTRILPRTPVLGVAVADRATVKAALRIEAAVRTFLPGSRPRGPFIDRLLDVIRMDTLDAHALPGPHLRVARDFVRHARALYEGRAWARGFLDAWLTRAGSERWTFHALPSSSVERPAAPCRVHPDRHRIELSPADDFAYLSPVGLRSYDMRRRVAHVLAELALPERARQPRRLDGETERGGATYAENKLLGLAAGSDERRVAARVWERAREAPFAFPRVNPTLARRVADDEDRYLASVVPPTPETGDAHA